MSASTATVSQTSSAAVSHWQNPTIDPRLSSAFGGKHFMWSLGIHLGCIAVAISISAIDWRPDPPDMEVVRVKLAAGMKSAPVAEEKTETVAPVPPVAQEPPPVDDKAVVVDKPKDKKPEKVEPKKKLDEKKAPPKQSTLSRAESSDTAVTEGAKIEQKFSNAEFSGAFEDANFTYGDWQYQGFRKIAQNWRNTVFSAEPISCAIYFRVLRSGRVYAVAVKRSSGIERYDRDCLDAVNRANPLPPLPREYGREEVGISLIFPYKPQ